MFNATLTILPLIVLMGFLYLSKGQIKQLSIRVLLGLVFGIAYGALLKVMPPNVSSPFVKNILIFIGDGYLELLKMLVIPLILTSITYSILNLGTDDKSNIKKLSFYTCSILLGMTALASFIGIMVGQAFSVGSNLNLPSFALTPKHVNTGLTDTLLNMLPSNIVLAMTQDNAIAIVLIAVLIGLAARSLKAKDNDKLTTFKNLITSLFAITKKLAVLILSLTPYGTFALISLLVFEYGTVFFSSMFNFITAMYVAMLIVMIMHSIILLCVGMNPITYFKNAYLPLVVAFTTRSSFGTLPVTEETLLNQFKTKQSTATFVPSIGATIGMNACAGVFPAMVVAMTMNIMNLPITPHFILMVMIINMIASLGISGIPGTAYIAATVTLTSLNLPYSVVALVQGIDPIIDMGRTAVNVNGAMTTALVVDKVDEEKRDEKLAEQVELIDSKISSSI